MNTNLRIRFKNLALETAVRVSAAIASHFWGSEAVGPDSYPGGRSYTLVNKSDPHIAVMLVGTDNVPYLHIIGPAYTDASSKMDSSVIFRDAFRINAHGESKLLVLSNSQKHDETVETEVSDHYLSRVWHTLHPERGPRSSDKALADLFQPGGLPDDKKAADMLHTVAHTFKTFMACEKLLKTLSL